MVGELESVVTGKFINVAGVFVLFVSIEAIPVVVLNGRSSFMNIISWTLVTFRKREIRFQLMMLNL